MKRIKKLASLFLAMVMVLAMTMTAFAADGDYTLTINTVKGHTYKIYQLATGDVSENGQKLSNIAVGANAKTDTTIEKITALEGMSGADLGDAAEALVDTTGSPAAEIVAGDEDGAKSVTLAGGYYVIIDTYSKGNTTDPTDGSDSRSRTMVTLVKDTTMTPKNTTIKPDKKIIDENQELDTNEVSIGDVVTYKLSGLVPDMQDFTTFKYVFVDTMSKGLTPTNDIKVGETLTGSVGSKTATFQVTGLTTDNDGVTTIRIALLNAINYKDDKGATVSVQITAILNKEAVVAPGSNPNTVKIDYSNDSNAEYDGSPDFGPTEPKGTTPEVEVKTYTTELTITKVDGEGNKLPGAKFKLESVGSTVSVGYVTGQEYVEDANGTWYKLVDNAYTQTAPAQDGSDANKYASTSTKYKLVEVNKETYTTGAAYSSEAFVDGREQINGEDNVDYGTVKFTGLGQGKYKLSEVVTPDGYNSIASDIEFEITWTKEGGFAVTNVTEGYVITVSSSADGLGTVLGTEIKNLSGALLPSTGGIGTTIFYVVGGILVIGAGILLVTKKRMSAR